MHIGQKELSQLKGQRYKKEQCAMTRKIDTSKQTLTAKLSVISNLWVGGIRIEILYKKSNYIESGGL